MTHVISKPIPPLPQAVLIVVPLHMTDLLGLCRAYPVSSLSLCGRHRGAESAELGLQRVLSQTSLR